jgi:hypothetical protein
MAQPMICARGNPGEGTPEDNTLYDSRASTTTIKSTSPAPVKKEPKVILPSSREDMDDGVFSRDARVDEPMAAEDYPPEVPERNTAIKANRNLAWTFEADGEDDEVQNGAVDVEEKTPNNNVSKDMYWVRNGLSVPYKIVRISTVFNWNFTLDDILRGSGKDRVFMLRDMAQPGISQLLFPDVYSQMATNYVVPVYAAVHETMNDSPFAMAVKLPFLKDTVPCVLTTGQTSAFVIYPQHAVYNAGMQGSMPLYKRTEHDVRLFGTSKPTFLIGKTADKIVADAGLTELFKPSVTQDVSIPKNTDLGRFAMHYFGGQVQPEGDNIIVPFQQRQHMREQLESDTESMNYVAFNADKIEARLDFISKMWTSKSNMKDTVEELIAGFATAPEEGKKALQHSRFTVSCVISMVCMVFVKQQH